MRRFLRGKVLQCISTSLCRPVHLSTMLLYTVVIKVRAEGLGKGGEVRIQEYGLKGIFSRTLERGEVVTAVVRKVVDESKVVLLDAIDQ